MANHTWYRLLTIYIHKLFMRSERKIMSFQLSLVIAYKKKYSKWSAWNDYMLTIKNQKKKKKEEKKDLQCNHFSVRCTSWAKAQYTIREASILINPLVLTGTGGRVGWELKGIFTQLVRLLTERTAGSRVLVKLWKRFSYEGRKGAVWIKSKLRAVRNHSSIWVVLGLATAKGRGSAAVWFFYLLFLLPVILPFLFTVTVIGAQLPPIFHC